MQHSSLAFLVDFANKDETFLLISILFFSYRSRSSGVIPPSFTISMSFALIVAALRHSDSFIANLTKQQPTGQRVAFCVMQCWRKFEGVSAYIFK